MRRFVVLLSLVFLFVVAAALDVRSLRKRETTKRTRHHAMVDAAECLWNAFPVLAGANLGVKYAARFTDTAASLQPVNFGTALAPNVHNINFRYALTDGVHQVMFRLPSTDHPLSTDAAHQCLSGNVATINGVTSGHLAWIRGPDNGQITCPNIPGANMMGFYDKVVEGFGGTSSELTDGMQVFCTGVAGRQNMYYKVLKPITSTGGACGYYERYGYGMDVHGTCTVAGLAAACAALRAVTLNAVAAKAQWVKDVVAESGQTFETIKNNPFATWFDAYNALQRNEGDAGKKQVMCDKVKKIYDLFGDTLQAKLGAPIAASVKYFFDCAGLRKTY